MAGHRRLGSTLTPGEARIKCHWVLHSCKSNEEKELQANTPGSRESRLRGIAGNGREFGNSGSGVREREQERAGIRFRVPLLARIPKSPNTRPLLLPLLAPAPQHRIPNPR